jgi:hypothetical protein
MMLAKGCLRNMKSRQRYPWPLFRQSSDMEEVVDPVTSRPSWKGAQQKCAQGARHITRSGSLESIESSDSPHTPDEPAQLKQADYSHDRQCFPNRSDTPRDRQQPLSREQSFVRVAAENQHAKIEPFQVWAVDIGQWGGRELVFEDPKNSPAVSEVSLKDWMATSETDPFTMNPPDSLHHLVQSKLAQDNAHLARSHVQTRISDSSAISTPSPPQESINMGTTSKQLWSVGSGA